MSELQQPSWAVLERPPNSSWRLLQFCSTLEQAEDLAKVYRLHPGGGKILVVFLQEVAVSEVVDSDETCE